MHAVVVPRYGGPEVLTYEERPIPTPGTGDALVRLTAIGVNFIDVYQREGKYEGTLPFVAGNEAAGIVQTVGQGVTEFKVGDRVAYCGIRGSYAGYAVVSAARLVRVPPDIDDRTAAAAMTQGITAEYLSTSTYPIRKGDVALVHAAAGGVGLLLTQMAHRAGARVIGTAGTPEKMALAREAGAADVIQYTTQDFETEVKRLTNNGGVNVVYDSVGKTTFEKGLNVLKPRGTMVSFGQSSGNAPAIEPLRLVKGSLYLTRPTLADYIATTEELRERAAAVFSMIERGELSIRIGETYPLADAAQAHRDLEARKTTGKVILIP